MNSRVIGKCLEGTASSVSFATVDVKDPSAFLAFHTSGGAGTGSVKIVGVTNTGFIDRLYSESKNELYGTQSLDVTSYWTATRCAVSAINGSTNLPFSKGIGYYQVSGSLTAAGTGQIPTVNARYQDNNYLPADVDKTNVFSLYVKQYEVEAFAASSCKLALFNLDGDNAATRQHSIRFNFPTYGGAPELATEGDAITAMSFSSIQSVGNGWYRLAVGIKPSDFLTGSPENEQDNDRLLATYYLGTDNDPDSWLGLRMYVTQPQAEYFDTVPSIPSTYYPVFTTDKYNFDILPVVYEDSSLAANSNTGSTIVAYPHYQIKIENLSTTDANIKTYLVHNANAK